MIEMKFLFHSKQICIYLLFFKFIIDDVETNSIVFSCKKSINHIYIMIIFTHNLYFIHLYNKFIRFILKLLYL